MLAILGVGYSFWVSVLLSCPIILGAKTTKMLDIGLEKQTGSITPWTWRRNLQFTMSVCFSYTAACPCGPGVCWGSMWQAAYLLLVFLKVYLCVCYLLPGILQSGSRGQVLMISSFERSSPQSQCPAVETEKRLVSEDTFFFTGKPVSGGFFPVASDFHTTFSKGNPATKTLLGVIECGIWCWNSENFIFHCLCFCVLQFFFFWHWACGSLVIGKIIKQPLCDHSLVMP